MGPSLADVPEGDTIFRIAERLRPALIQQVVTRLDAPRLAGPRPAAGSTVTAVEAKGKHLLIAFSDRTVIETHLRMTGSWHLYRTGERWRRAAHLARLVVEVDGWTAVCFSAPVVRSHRVAAGAEAGTAVRDALLDHLGPDLTRDDADLEAAVARMASIPEPTTPLAEVLLDQRVVAGIGNVFKSEVCWACRADPFTPIAEVPEDLRQGVVTTAHRQVRANLGSCPRTTVPGGLAVYGRRGEGCLRCGTPIRMARQGELARSTYWCPRCQPQHRSAERYPPAQPNDPGGPMAASRDEMKAVAQRYVELYNAGDPDAVASLYTEDAWIEDPIGSPKHEGRDAIRGFYATMGSAASGAQLTLTGPARLTDTNELAFPMQARVAGGESSAVMDIIDVMTLDQDGRVTSMRAFWSFTDMRTE